MRLLGECYNYMLLDSRTLFELLYACLSHGHDSPESAARLDPPDDFFRVRMVRGALWLPALPAGPASMPWLTGPGIGQAELLGMPTWCQASLLSPLCWLCPCLLETSGCIG